MRKFIGEQLTCTKDKADLQETKAKVLEYLFRIIDQTEQREYIIDYPLYSIVRLLISMSDRLNCLYNITQKPHDTTVNYKKLIFN